MRVRGFHAHRLSVLHITLEFTSLKALMSLKVKFSHNSIDLLLILEQRYNNDYNDDDTAALAHFSLRGAFFQSCYRL